MKLFSSLIYRFRAIACLKLRVGYSVYEDTKVTGKQYNKYISVDLILVSLHD